MCVCVPDVHMRDFLTVCVIREATVDVNDNLPLGHNGLLCCLQQ